MIKKMISPPPSPPCFVSFTHNVVLTGTSYYCYGCPYIKKITMPCLTIVGSFLVTDFVESTDKE